MNFRWTKILGLIGLFIGLIQGYHHGIQVIEEFAGYALPYAILFLAIGFIFDFIGSRFGKK
jgi:hypothetical protein